MFTITLADISVKCTHIVEAVQFWQQIAPQKNAAILFAFKDIQTKIDRATRCGPLINRPTE